MAHLLKLAGVEGESKLETFSYMASEFDESPQIFATAKQTGAKLNRLELDADEFWTRLTEVMRFQDEPLHSMNVVISYELYRMAAGNGVKVILNGQGADEVLAGYPSYFVDYWYSLMQSGNMLECWREIEKHCAVHGGVCFKRFSVQLVHFLQTQLARFSAYRHMASWRHNSRMLSSDWYTDDFKKFAANDTRDFEHQTLTNALYESVYRSPLPLYLRVEDRNSMAHSVETRVPFLDYRLVNFAFRLRDNLKIRAQWNKYILRKAMKNRIPEIVRTRIDKMGFPVPQSSWFSGVLFNNIAEIINSRKLRERGIFNADNVLRDLTAFRHGAHENDKEFFRVIQFEKFCRMIEEPLQNQVAGRAKQYTALSG